jgi:alanyl-tRNA synthetase
MTDRLYYSDPYLSDFDAHVLRADVLDSRHVAVLNRTAFYPTSGGQPFDTGSLGVTKVIDVIDGEREIIHVLDRPLRAGESVRGSIDWARRFDHMQQHTGQHVLSAAFDRRLGARTESFHLGTASATIDLSRTVSAAEIAGAEEDANRIVWEDRLVTIRFADATEAAALPLRKESHRPGTLRLIDIEEFDISACGGTHVARTGAIGVIAVAGWEKFRAGTRIEFVCGGRALRVHRTLRDAAIASNKLLSVTPLELPAAIERLQAEVKAANRSNRELQARLAGHEAERLIRESSPDRPVVVEVLEGWDLTGLKAIASAVTRHPGYAAALISAPAPSAVVVACTLDAATDAAGVLRALIDHFGGKGGGRPDLAQGGGLQGDPREIASMARVLLQP